MRVRMLVFKWQPFYWKVFMKLEQMNQLSTQAKDTAPELTIEASASSRREMVIESIMETLDVA